MRFVLLAALFLVSPAQAQVQCSDYVRVTVNLYTQYGEERLVSGILDRGIGRLEIWAAPDGSTWTALVIGPDNLACVTAWGTDWTFDGPGIPERES